MRRDIGNMNEDSKNKPDKRTLKTRKALRNGLAELLTEKELRKITVQEIADKADVNRVTFYKHYLDVYDLYDKVEEELLIEMGLLILRLTDSSSDRVFSDLISYIGENRTMFRMIFSPNSSGTLRDKFSKLMEGLFLQIQAEKQHSDISDNTLEYRNCYRAQGCIAVISKWVLGDFEESADFIVRIISELDHNTEKLISDS